MNVVMVTPSIPLPPALPPTQVPFTAKHPPAMLIPFANVEVALPATLRFCIETLPEKVEVEFVPVTFTNPLIVEVPVASPWIVVVAVRPTADKVKGALFNILMSRGAIEGTDLLDLFAGSGALGIEALSRGAHSVTFVDQSTVSTRVLRDNLAQCRFDEQARVLQNGLGIGV